MLIYILLFLFLTFYSFVGIKRRIKSNVYYWAVFILVAFAAFRGNGYDWISYNDIYNNTHLGIIYSGVTFVEYGFLLLCYLSPTYSILIAITAYMSIFLTLRYLYKISFIHLPLLGLIVFYTTILLPTYMGQIRQGLAIGFTTLAVYTAFWGKKSFAITWIVIAAFFHISALLALVVIFVSKKQYSIKLYLILLLIIYFISSSFIFVFSNLYQYDQLGIIQKLTYYTAIEKEELGMTSTIVIRILTFLGSVKLNRPKDVIISYICNIYLCGIIIYILFGFLPQLGGRGSLYFTIFEVVLVPFIISKLKNKPFLYFIGYFLILGLSAFRLISFFSSELNRNSYIPYSLY